MKYGMELIQMGDTFESLNPESYYEGELAKLSGELMKTDALVLSD